MGPAAVDKVRREERAERFAHRLDRKVALEHLGFSLGRHDVMIGLTLATVLLMSFIFAPYSVWPLSLVCLVPWCIMLGGAWRAPWVYLYSYLGGLVFFVANMQWLSFATGYGYLALAFYLAFYWPLAAVPIRHAIRRRRLPLSVVLPVVWVGTEMLRAVVISGFPWFFLGHSLYKVTWFIQISDVVGAYGPGFVVAAVNGLVVDWLLARIAQKRASMPATNVRRFRFSVVFVPVLVGLTLGYGVWQLNRDTLSPGPTIATIQGDFVNLVHGEETPEIEKIDIYLDMIEAASEAAPDLYVLPETAWFMFLNPEIRFDRSRAGDSRLFFDWFRDFAMKHEAYMVVGAVSEVPTDDLLVSERRHNSAYIFQPTGEEPPRYDKVHLVYFGEIVPFRFGRLRFLYLFMNRLMPFSGPDGSFEYSMFQGESFRTFEMKARTQGGKVFRFGVPICYEDVMPYISRRFTLGADGTKQVDFLANISNDGWFGRGHQQPQHLAVCTFRAVENRVPVVRSVNTGISGFITSNGYHVGILDRENADNPWPRTCGISVEQIQVDSRLSLYTRYGDWFGWLCVLLAGLLVLDYVAVRTWSRHALS